MNISDLKPFLTKQKIWILEQNKPSLIAEDLWDSFRIPPEATHDILLARGVYKWFTVRRLLIKMKYLWKSRICNTLSQIIELKRNKPFLSKSEFTYKLAYARGYLKAYEECRKEVRALCHSQRWQAPDIDRKAQYHLALLEDK